MKESTPRTCPADLQGLFHLTGRVGSDPLLTQASTGNSSAKRDGVLWIKASGKWMADAAHDDIFLPLDLAQVSECLRQGVDPADRYRGASLETALHATLPHRMVLHVHCVDTIAWAVRHDGMLQFRRLLDGLPWQWIPYVASGLPLARAMEQALHVRPETNLFVLGNHGLVVCGEDADSIESLLAEVRRRVAIHPRAPNPADYDALEEIAQDSPWILPADQAVHSLGTDAVSQAIVASGVLYPCQAIFSGSAKCRGSAAAEMFRPIPFPDPAGCWRQRYRSRPFLIVGERGVVVSRTMAPAELAMISGLAQVVQRLSAAAPLRYLTETEIAAIPGEAASRYRELSSRR